MKLWLTIDSRPVFVSIYKYIFLFLNWQTRPPSIDSPIRPNHTKFTSSFVTWDLEHRLLQPLSEIYSGCGNRSSYRRPCDWLLYWLNKLLRYKKVCWWPNWSLLLRRCDRRLDRLIGSIVQSAKSQEICGDSNFFHGWWIWLIDCWFGSINLFIKVCYLQSYFVAIGDSPEAFKFQDIHPGL